VPAMSSLVEAWGVFDDAGLVDAYDNSPDAEAVADGRKHHPHVVHLIPASDLDRVVGVLRELVETVGDARTREDHRTYEHDRDAALDAARAVLGEVGKP
jgi:hypothetical protein